MKLLVGALCLVALLHTSYAPPIETEKKTDHNNEENKDDLEKIMEYHRYLQEVVHTLESDPEFKERLEKADEEEIRSGKIAEQLDFVSHNVRSQLDEIKRRELDRLRHLATKQFELTNDLGSGGKVPTNEHLDHNNPHTFEIEDLKKLIKKTTQDLEEADQKRREQFKEYEMEKQFEKQQKLEQLDETHKKEYMEKIKEDEKAKKHHKQLHHPGSKPQLEEVWEKQDHMDQQFDPKAFFMMHDVDGNGVWDPEEVKALFIKELDKLYGPGGPNKDMQERAEEMERMREHVFRENDRNHDGLLDFNEFLLQTKQAEFDKDEGWKSIDENQIYTQDEYHEFEKRRLEELSYLQQRGLVDAHGVPIPGAERQIAKARRDFETQLYYQKLAQQGHPEQFQQGQYQGRGQFQQPHQQQPHQQQYQQQQQYQPHPPPQQYQPHPSQQQYQPHPPQQQQFQQQQYQQPPQQQQYQQPPQQQQQHYQQPPQQQQQYQQPPQQQQQYQQPPQQQQQYQQPPQQQYQQPPQQQQQQQQYQQPPQQPKNQPPIQNNISQPPVPVQAQQQNQGQSTQAPGQASNAQAHHEPGPTPVSAQEHRPPAA